MAQWKIAPDPEWTGRDVFIIGGGSSLKTFDFNLLRNELTIGCNNAFELGKDICKICFFGDDGWFFTFGDRLKEYVASGGSAFTSRRLGMNYPWLRFVPRVHIGVSREALGWNHNSGSSAINLALILGAKRVFLLGFDMKLSPSGDANWHINTVSKPNPENYKTYRRKFVRIAKSIREVFPDREVINVSDSTSLAVFPIVGMKEFWNERANNGMGTSTLG